MAISKIFISISLCLVYRTEAQRHIAASLPRVGVSPPEYLHHSLTSAVLQVLFTRKLSSNHQRLQSLKATNRNSTNTSYTISLLFKTKFTLFGIYTYMCSCIFDLCSYSWRAYLLIHNVIFQKSESVQRLSPRQVKSSDVTQSRAIAHGWEDLDYIYNLPYMIIDIVKQNN